MQRRPILLAVSILTAGALSAACDDQPTAPAPAAHANGASSHTPADAANLVLPEAFTARAAMAPYFINQNPDLMLRSQVTADLAIQRIVTPSGGGGGWHTHPGPSFAIVESGAVMITRYSRKTGCTSVVYGPGQPGGSTYYEVADEVHIAEVVSETHAVEYKVRFNVPAGAPFGNAADPPSC